MERGRSGLGLVGGGNGCWWKEGDGDGLAAGGRRECGGDLVGSAPKKKKKKKLNGIEALVTGRRNDLQNSIAY
ncbi:hypothetical protein ACH5RR_025253 [Cinchona calisaya]|uniref:Uncharacterized protein n=1 Tax=Cinchona calisaya TaxID=153742 RepID=A0ABD2YZR1_9GENT